LASLLLITIKQTGRTQRFDLQMAISLPTLLKKETKMEENLHYEDEEENRHFRRYRRWAKESRHDFDDREPSGSADSFDAIWEGRS
jgi:hypothetical protein